jgi:hypothetical protein
MLNDWTSDCPPWCAAEAAQSRRCSSGKQVGELTTERCARNGLAVDWPGQAVGGEIRGAAHATHPYRRCAHRPSKSKLEYTLRHPNETDLPRRASAVSFFWPTSIGQEPPSALRNRRQNNLMPQQPGHRAALPRRCSPRSGRSTTQIGARARRRNAAGASIVRLGALMLTRSNPPRPGS